MCKSAYVYEVLIERSLVMATENVQLRALSLTSGDHRGGVEMHVVGTPFIKGPALKCLVRTPNGQAEVRYNRGLERYSDTVLFFPLPACPEPINFDVATPGTVIRATVQVTNDGRHFSNGLDFSYVVGMLSIESNRIESVRGCLLIDS